MFKEKLRSQKMLPLISVTALMIVVFSGEAGGLFDGWKDCN